VQDVLVRSERAGYLTRALVVNAANRIVAALDKRSGSGQATGSGQIRGVEMLRIGDLAPDPIPNVGRKIDISLGSRYLGRLLILDARVAAIPSANDGAADLRAAATLMAALSLLAAGIVTWLWRRVRNGGIAVPNGSPRAQGAATAMKLPGDTESLAPAGGKEGPQDAKAELRRRLADSRARRDAPKGGTG
jgi:hypothetical protein